MKKIFLFLIFTFFVSCSASKEKSFIPEVVSPDVYDVLFENDDVKVLGVTFPPGKGDNMHDHNPITFYVLQGGKGQVTLPDGSVNEREVPTGFVGHNRERQRHQVKNIGQDTLKFIIIEHKNLKTASAAHEKLTLPEEVSPEVYKVLLENDDVKVVEVVFEPGQSDKMHQHGVMTFYGVKGGKLQSTLPDGTVNENQVPDGFTGHRNTITTHQMKNIGEEEVKVILVEHKYLSPRKNG